MTENRSSLAASRLGPHSVEAEEAVLGSVLINAEVLPPLLEFLKPEDFFELKHAWIWEAMAGLYERREEVDYLTLIEALRQKSRLDEVGGPSFISYLINTTPTHINAEAYARLVERSAVRRRLITAASEIAQLARSEPVDVEKIIAEAELKLFAVTERGLRREAIPMTQAVREYYDRIIDLHNNPEKRLGLPCGFRDIDKLLGGLQRSDLIIVAARPGVGKTSFLLSVALNAARAATAPIAIFTLEMGREQLVQRFYASETGIDSQRLRSGTLESSEWGRFNEATGRLDQLNIYIDDTPGISVLDMRNRCRRLYREHGLSLIIVDYLQLMSAGVAMGRNENRVQEVSAISRGLKELARELNVPLLTAAQLSRSVEQRGDKRPQLSDLRESGSIEQDADIVMFLYRDELYNENTERPNQADVIIAKHRNGPLGTVSLFFKKHLTQFADLSKTNVDLGDY